MRIALKFAYDGRNYSGYARQPNLPTVEGELLKTLISQETISDAKQSQIRSASRTDKGVSALGNVIAFNTPSLDNELIQHLNEELSEIIIYATAEVPDDFYPRYAQQRIYRYYLNKQTYNRESILSTASLFTGTHNFRNFARVEEYKDPKRTIDAIIVSEDTDFFIIEFYAQTYLWHQIRRIISAIEQVEQRKITPDNITNALEQPDKQVDYGIASAHPLILTDILYSFDFQYIKKYQKKVIEIDQKIQDSLKN